MSTPQDIVEIGFEAFNEEQALDWARRHINVEGVKRRRRAPWGHVYSLRTEQDSALLKATPPNSSAEPSLLPVLASRHPEHTGSVLASYTGPRIDRAGLLRYIASYRQHQDFHETCVERIFLDIMERCKAEKLTVYARYQRRGGIDINPFRSNFEDEPPNPRLWRQ